MIDLRQFRQFIAVAEELSFRRAAAKLHMAQPPLTGAIRKIETELNVLLFERTNRITRLTDAGKAFLLEARRTIEQSDRAIQAAIRAHAGLTSSLRVSFVDSTINSLVPAALLAFHARFPEVEIRLLEGSTSEQLTALREDRTDLALIVLPVGNHPDLELKPLLRDKMIAALPIGHPLAKRKSVSLHQLAAEPWILFPAHLGPGLHASIIRACAAAGFFPRIVQEARQMHTTAGLVAGGIGVALMPRIYGAVSPQGAVFRPIVGDGGPIPYDLALAYRTPSMLQQEFSKTLHELVVRSPFGN